MHVVGFDRDGHNESKREFTWRTNYEINDSEHYYIGMPLAPNSALEIKQEMGIESIFSRRGNICVLRNPLKTRRKRAILNAAQAAEIFKLRETCSNARASSPSDFAPLCRSTQIAAIYGVSPKAVRDIWNR